jgi:hypothetical protein
MASKVPLVRVRRGWVGLGLAVGGKLKLTLAACFVEEMVTNHSILYRQPCFEARYSWRVEHDRGRAPRR